VSGSLHTHLRLRILPPSSRGRMIILPESLHPPLGCSPNLSNLFNWLQDKPLFIPDVVAHLADDVQDRNIRQP
jgi:hypothetical protein